MLRCMGRSRACPWTLSQWPAAASQRWAWEVHAGRSVLMCRCLLKGSDRQLLRSCPPQAPAAAQLQDYLMWVCGGME